MIIKTVVKAFTSFKIFLHFYRVQNNIKICIEIRRFSLWTKGEKNAGGKLITITFDSSFAHTRKSLFLFVSKNVYMFMFEIVKI